MLNSGVWMGANQGKQMQPQQFKTNSQSFSKKFPHWKYVSLIRYSTNWPDTWKWNNQKWSAFLFAVKRYHVAEPTEHQDIMGAATSHNQPCIEILTSSAQKRKLIGEQRKQKWNAGNIRVYFRAWNSYLKAKWSIRKLWLEPRNQGSQVSEVLKLSFKNTDPM